MPTIQPKINPSTPRLGNRNNLPFAISFTVLMVTAWYLHIYSNGIGSSGEDLLGFLFIPVIAVEACMTALFLYRLIQERVQQSRSTIGQYFLYSAVLGLFIFSNVRYYLLSGHFLPADLIEVVVRFGF